MEKVTNERAPKISLIIIVFIGALYLTIIQQLPIIKDLYYAEIRIVLYVLLSIVLIASLPKFKIAFRSFHFKFFTGTIIFTSLMYIIFVFNGVTVPLTELMVPYIILLISMTLNVTAKQLKFIIFGYIILALIMGVSNVLFYSGSFQINELYTVPYKNQLGPILGISIIILFHWITQGTNDFIKNKLVLYGMLFGLLLSLFVIRNRATILALLFILLIMLLINYFSNLSIKKIIGTIFVCILILLMSVVGYTQIIFNYIWESFTLNYDVDDLNSLSAGRTDVYKDSLDFIISNPFLGEITSSISFYTSSHNFILNKLILFGLIGSLPILIYYIYLVSFTFKGLLINVKKTNVIFWLMLFSLIVSQFEYTYPFGPGVSQILLWFILGQYLKRDL